MKNLNSRRQTWLSLVAVCWLALTQSSQAGLLYDIRFAATQPTGVTITDNKNIQVDPTATGAVINLELWAVVSNPLTNGNQKGFSATVGSFVSSVGSGLQKLQGNLSGGNSLTTTTLVNNVAPYNTAPGSTSGFLQDLNGDGDLDVGNLTDTTTAGSTNTWFAAVGPNSLANPGPPGAGLDASFLVGVLTFTITDNNLLPGDQAEINYVPRLRTSGALSSQNNQRWYEEGTLITARADSPLISIGSPAVISTIPEPGTLALGGILLAGLAGFKLRRKQA